MTAKKEDKSFRINLQAKLSLFREMETLEKQFLSLTFTAARVRRHLVESFPESALEDLPADVVELRQYLQKIGNK